MKNTALRWRFVNQTNPSETVLVHDQASAQTLATLLQKMSDEWMMQEERPLGSMQVTQPQPTQPAPVQAQQAREKTREIARPVPQASVHQASVHQAPAYQPEAIEEESAEDYALDANSDSNDMASAVLEAVVNAAHAQQAQSHQAQALGTPAPDRKVAPPPAPKKQDKRERRTAQRFMTEFRVILISGSSSFRTMSADVSLGGMRLKKTIPASFLKEKCIAYVSHKDLRENIEIVCHVVGDPADPCRIQFLQPNQTQLKRLNDWLIEHNNGVAKKVAS